MLAPWVIWLAELSLISVVVVVPLVIKLRPSPLSYVSFISQNWNVRIDRDDAQMPWLPHNFIAVFISIFVAQAVHCFLHYRLFFDVIGASVLEIGLVDAACHMTNAAATFGPLLALPRWKTFALQGSLAGFGYILMLGIAVPNAGQHWLKLFLAFLGQAAATMPFAFISYSVMRNDAKQDIIRDSSTEERWRNEDSVQAMLAQLQVMLKYPATLLASFVFPSFTARYGIGNAYILVGCICIVLWAWLAWYWVGFGRPKWKEEEDEKEKEEEEEEEVTEREGVNVFDEIKPGGRYFAVILQVSTYTAVGSIVRHGYSRMLNLRGLEMNEVTPMQLGWLLSAISAVSVSFFWLSDIATIGRRRGKRYVGVVSFVLMGLGHCVLGLAAGFNGLLSSAIVFGFGQATSTGLGTLWKDDVRDSLREEGRSVREEKLIMNIVGSVKVMTMIGNSLIVGLLGHFVGLQWTSFFFAAIAALGFGLTLFLLPQRDQNVAAAREVGSVGSGNVLSEPLCGT